MMQESIFEDIEIAPKEVKPIFRLVGILRLIISILLVITSLALLISFSTTIYFKLIGGQNATFNVQNLFVLLIPLFFYTIMLLYYLPQLKYELVLSPKLFDKRRFRLFTVILNLIFIIAFLVTMNVNRWHIAVFSISGVITYSLIALFIGLVVIDIRLFATQNRIVN